MKQLGIVVIAVAVVGIATLIYLNLGAGTNDKNGSDVSLEAAVDTSLLKFSASQTLAELSVDELAKAKAQGDQLYRRFQCVSCHADNGRALKTLENLGQKYDLTTLPAYLRRPREPMPVFPLSDEDRVALAVYLIDRYPGSAQD